MKTLILIEHDALQIKIGTYASIQAAKMLNQDVEALVIGFECGAVAEKISKIEGVRKVWIADNVVYQYAAPETYAPLVAKMVNSYTHVIAAASAFGRDLMPRVAGILGVEQISDVMEIVSDDVFVRSIYAGRVLTKIKLSDPIKLLTIKTTAFENFFSEQDPVDIVSVDIVSKENNAKIFLEKEIIKNENQSLADARVVISAGRAVQSDDYLDVIKSIANKLNAAIGASKPPVEAGVLPHYSLVGQTGKMIAPDLYIAVGISGASQHIAGIKDSKIIVAINKDKDAPIFQIADYGLVGDVLHILPELDKALEKIQMEKTV